MHQEQWSTGEGRGRKTARQEKEFILGGQFNEDGTTRIEAGRCNLTLGTLQRIVLALELEIEDLFQFPPRVVPTPSGIPRGCWPRDGNDRQPRPGALKKLQIFIMEILDRKP